MQLQPIIQPTADTPERPARAPAWILRHQHAPLRLLGGDETSVLFSYSNRSTQEALHLFREERGNA